MSAEGYNAKNYIYTCSWRLIELQILPPYFHFFIPDCLYGLLSLTFLLNYSVFVFSFSLVFVSVPCAGLSWTSRQLLIARKSTVPYRIVYDY